MLNIDAPEDTKPYFDALDTVDNTPEIEDESKLRLDAKAFEKDLTERGEFVREAGRYEMKPDFLSEVLEVGLKALSGEEIDL